jgi:hypothetical protein
MVLGVEESPQDVGVISPILLAIRPQVLQSGKLVLIKNATCEQSGAYLYYYTVVDPQQNSTTGPTD